MSKGLDIISGSPPFGCRLFRILLSLARKATRVRFEQSELLGQQKTTNLVSVDLTDSKRAEGKELSAGAAALSISTSPGAPLDGTSADKPIDALMFAKAALASSLSLMILANTRIAASSLYRACDNSCLSEEACLRSSKTSSMEESHSFCRPANREGIELN